MAWLMITVLLFGLANAQQGIVDEFFDTSGGKSSVHALEPVGHQTSL